MWETKANEQIAFNWYVSKETKCAFMQKNMQKIQTFKVAIT